MCPRDDDWILEPPDYADSGGMAPVAPPPGYHIATQPGNADASRVPAYQPLGAASNNVLQFRIGSVGRRAGRVQPVALRRPFDPPLPFAGQLLGELVCPPRLVVAGARGYLDAEPPTIVIRGMAIECAPVYEVAASSQVIVDRGDAALVVSSALPFLGAEQYSIGCDGGNVATGLFESSGSWLDGFALSCTSLRRPRLAGDACSAGDACQSGVCDGSGSCAGIEP